MSTPSKTSDSEPKETKVVSQVPPNTAAKSMSDSEITFSQLDPGIIWAVANKQATVDQMVERYGPHMKDLLSDYA